MNPRSAIDLPAVRMSTEIAAHVALGLLSCDGATVLEWDARLDAPLAAAAARVGQDYSPALHRACDEAVSAVRQMYRAFDIDPTKTRPSSEALLRRVRKGEPLPRVNSLVDICNWCSLELQLPYGLYDADRIEGPIELRVGWPGEEYAGIRKEAVHVTGRPALVDAKGPFGNPTSDSARTMVTTETTRALVVIFAPRHLADRVESALDLTADRIAEFTGGRETARRTI